MYAQAETIRRQAERCYEAESALDGQHMGDLAGYPPKGHVPKGHGHYDNAYSPWSQNGQPVSIRIGEGCSPCPGGDFARHTDKAAAALGEPGMSGRDALDRKNDFDGAHYSIPGEVSQRAIERDHDVTGPKERHLAGLAG